MIEKSIKRILQERGRVVVLGFGTLESEPVGSEMNDSGSIISPPNCIVEYSPSDIDLENLLVKDVSQRTGIPLEDAEKQVKLYGERVVTQVKIQGTSEITGLGTISNIKGRYQFDLFDEVNLLPESYGLPKVHARPLFGEVISNVNENEGKTTTQISVLWLGLIGVIIFGAFLTYLFTNEQARHALKSAFSSSDSSKNQINIVDTINTTIDANAPVVKSEEKNSSSNKEVKEDKKNKEDSKTSKKEENVAMNKSSNSNIISSKTNRYYLIVGSYADVKSAEKAMNAAKAKGYSNAKVVKSDKIRVSIGDYSSKDEADKAIQKAKKDYASCWRLLY
jgi:cell division septation protein DedD/nucleoid DNA-binding protein